MASSKSAAAPKAPSKGKGKGKGAGKVKAKGAKVPAADKGGATSKPMAPPVTVVAAKVAVKLSGASSSKLKKAKGQSLHIGLNRVSPAAYDGWSGELSGCEPDAHSMAAIATARGLSPTVMLNDAATRAAVLAAVQAAAKSLVKGDLFVLSYSGHGGQVPDVTGEEEDKLDETWCLFDGQLIDDELYLALSRFKAGVRVLVVSDSCHSGTVVRGANAAAAGSAKSRQMPVDVGDRTYLAHHDFYDKLQRQAAKAAGKRVVDPDVALAQLSVSARLTAIVKNFKPAVVLISGCQDNQVSYDGPRNGAFTTALLKVWNKGAFAGTLAQFHAQIRGAMPARQSPNLFALGPAAPFLAQAPFTV